MAAFTSKANGNWSSGGQTTWNEAGVPGAGDTVSIAHSITVDVNTAIGTSPNDAVTKAITQTVARTLTVAPGVTLTVRGSIQMVHDGGLALGAGSHIVFDNSLSGGSPIYVVVNGGFTHYTFVGTAQARCSLGAIVGQSISISGAAWATVSMTFADLLRISGLTITNVSGNMTLTDVTFTGCNEFRPTSNSTVLSMILRRVRFVGGTHATSDMRLEMSTVLAGGTREISDCVLTKGWTNFTKSFTIVRNYFGGNMESISGSTQTAVFRHNFVKLDGDGGGGNGIVMGASCQRNYFVVENLDGNPHYIGPQALLGADNYVEQNVFEANTPDLVDMGDCVMLVATCCSGGRKIVVRNNIVLKNAQASVSSGTIGTLYQAPASTLSDWLRNTANINDSVSAPGKRGAFSTAEGGTGFAGQIAQLKSNVVWGSTPGQGYVAERIAGNVKDIITPAGADRNWRHNTTAGNNQRGYDDNAAANTLWTAGDAVAAGVDANGAEDDPEFHDATRNLATWCAARGYGAATFAAGLLALQADPARAADLITYVFDGFRVQNAAARNAAHDGGPVGAANYLKPTRYFAVVDALGAYLQTKYSIAGSSVAPIEPVTLAVTVAVVRGISVTTELSR